MRILNLGAGNKVIPGAVNHDRTAHRPEIDVVHDLNLMPWPWEDNAFDLIVARAVLEHLCCTLIESLGECWRILRPRGQLQVKLPYCRAEQSYDDPTHYWHFTLRSLDYFDPDTKYGHDYGFYTPRKWKIVGAPKLNPSRSSIWATLQVRK